jgi:hypothetical protein
MSMSIFLSELSSVYGLFSLSINHCYYQGKIHIILLLGFKTASWQLKFPAFHSSVHISACCETNGTAVFRIIVQDCA